MSNPRRICFVSGTRAEFGLMRAALLRLREHPDLELQIVATGMHLDRSRGRTVNEMRGDGWSPRIVAWPETARTPAQTAQAAGRAQAGLARVFSELKSDIVFVVGDRVEAFAASAAAHVSGLLVAHVHGGDRALGLIDDSLRHAITKLAHIHFPATAQSRRRLLNLGEDSWRIFRCGSPGLDDVRSAALAWKEVATRFAGLKRRRFALLALHPQSTSEQAEGRLAEEVIKSLCASAIERTIVVYPNNDPGSDGIARRWDRLTNDSSFSCYRNLPRAVFLGLLREAAFLVGNSSSGIIEAASFGTPVIDIGSRQAGRERGTNVIHCADESSDIRRAVTRVWNRGSPLRFPARNIYGAGGAGKKIAAALAAIPLDRFRRKLISY